MLKTPGGVQTLNQSRWARKRAEARNISSAREYLAPLDLTRQAVYHWTLDDQINTPSLLDLHAGLKVYL